MLDRYLRFLYTQKSTHHHFIHCSVPCSFHLLHLLQRACGVNFFVGIERFLSAVSCSLCWGTGLLVCGVLVSPGGQQWPGFL